ncbi:MAG: LysR substrate-binding domain-containing protein [Porticoccaceae bacterium]|nr:LysR substrate-binding domain-containing protein [Porticoccaceae bacterium]
MDPVTLSRVDLNLLVSLQVLLEERNVTRAAARLFITQPAMSKTLQRLRDLYRDPLLVRSGRGLAPTPKAQELQRQLPEVLASISDLVRNKEISPRKFTGEIRMAMPEFLAVLIVPKLVQILSQEAPNLTLAVASELGSYVEELEEGTVDFAIEREEELPADFDSAPLGGFTLACWMRRGHPLADDELTVERMLRYKWVHYYMLNTESISSRSSTLFDQWLARQGYTREKLLVTTQLMTALDTVYNTDCLMIGSLQDLEVEGEFYDIVRKPLPESLQVEPFFPLGIVSHRRTATSPMHRWIVSKTAQVVEDMRSERAPDEQQELTL